MLNSELEYRAYKIIAADNIPDMEEEIEDLLADDYHFVDGGLTVVRDTKLRRNMYFREMAKPWYPTPEIMKVPPPISINNNDFTDLWEKAKFVEACEGNCFMDDDGWGEYVTELGVKSGITVKPSEILEDGWNDDFPFVDWYNR